MAKKQTAPKTEALSVRIDPRLRFGLELMARQQRRSVTGVVEWAIDKALTNEVVDVNANGHALSFADLISSTWRPNEVERLVNLAENFPNLLTYEESRVWEVIKHSPDFWESNGAKRSGRSIRRDVLVDQWEAIRPLVTAAAERSVLKGLSPPELEEAGVYVIPF